MPTRRVCFHLCQKVRKLFELSADVWPNFVAATGERP